MSKIPFLRPNLVPLEAYEPYLRRSEHSRVYTNYGPLNTLLEERIVAEWYAGEGRATTVGNATLGLMLAISQARRPGRYAVMPSFTFAATPLAAQWCGLEPVFVDVVPGEWTLDPVEMEATLARLGDEVAVVVPYATFGTFLDLAPYARLIERGIPVVVDAAPCFGSTLAGSHFGQGFAGSVVFSFHATKAFCIGEGGLIYSNDESFIGRVRQGANFGFDGSRSSVFIGMNAKLPEISAAVGLATLDAFADKRAIRLRLYRAYHDAFAATGLLERGFAQQCWQGDMVAHQFFPLLAPDAASRDQVSRTLAGQDIEARTYFSPACHVMPQFAGCVRENLGHTEALAARILSLPLWEEMDEADVGRVVEAVRMSIA